MDPSIIIAGAALAITLVDKLFGGAWNLSSKLSQIEISLRAAIESSKVEIEARQDNEIRSFGETVAAIKEHVRLVEFHIRDNYIRKDDFIVHMKSHDDLLRLNFENINSRLERIEKTLDAKA